MTTTTIEVSVETRDRLQKLKVHTRQPYNDVVLELLNENETVLQKPKR